MTRPLSVALCLATLSACGGGKSGGGAPADRAALVARIDSIVSAPIDQGKVAGASIAVVRGSDTIAVRGFGRASLELDVPTPPHAIYEIGSVTKQFTASAILQLVEQGKVDLDADVRTYLPDYNSQGRRIPVRRLMDHTSGIKGYTEMPEFGTLASQKLPRDTLVTLFSKQPFDFEPGEELIYNNSAYFLLGLIIEKVSGQPYAEYVKEHLFGPAGMVDAQYCSERSVQARKVQGYDTDRVEGDNPDSTRLVLKGYIDHTWPYSAGSLCASAIDLVAWNQALHGGRILGAEAYHELVTPGTLNDGTPVRYAKGIVPEPVLGHRAFEHGGGIPGFLSENLYFPDDSLSIVVLYNTAGPVGPEAAARAIAEAILGTPPDDSVPFEGDAATYAGTFTGRGRGRPTEITVVADSGRLRVKRAEADTGRVLRYLGGDTFGLGAAHYTFVRNGATVTGLTLDAIGTLNHLVRK
jgi:CubicO group peptidase (beta-lactamase class C family)